MELWLVSMCCYILIKKRYLCVGWKVTLLESMNKRCLFLEHAISVTGLSNVQVVRDRAEVLFRNTWRALIYYVVAVFDALISFLSCTLIFLGYRAELWTSFRVQRVL